MMKRAGILLVLAMLIGCKINTTGEFTLPSEFAKKPQVYFCFAEDCAKHLAYFINSSKKSAHCAFFDLDSKEVIGILAKKSKEIDVKLVIDNLNYKGQIKGSNIKTDTNSQLSHNKFCVIDDSAVWTGSYNPAERKEHMTDDNALAIYSKYLAINYEDEFKELWDGAYGIGGAVRYPVLNLNNKTIENYFCPEDQCANHLILELKKANQSIYFMTFSFTHEDIADAVLFSDAKDIKGVFDKSQAGSKYSQYNRLKDFGLDITLDANKAIMHHKVFIIDNETVVTGSFNPTQGGDKRNDENLIIIHDRVIAKKYLKEFERVFALTKTFK